MPPSVKKEDAPQSQVLFLNYGQEPLDIEAACTVGSPSINHMLGMLGATPGFIDSLPLANKRAILYLASHSVDWRSCTQEYKDIAFCWSRASRDEKSTRVGIRVLLQTPIHYAEFIWKSRIEQRIEELRQKSYELNRGICEIAPVIAIPPTQVLEAAVASEEPPSDYGISGTHAGTPPDSESEAMSTAVNTVSPIISEIAVEEPPDGAPDNSKTAPGSPTGETPAAEGSPAVKIKDDADDISIDVDLKGASELSTLSLDDDTMLSGNIDVVKETPMEPPATKKRKLNERDAVIIPLIVLCPVDGASTGDLNMASMRNMLQGRQN